MPKCLSTSSLVHMLKEAPEISGATVMGGSGPSWEFWKERYDKPQSDLRPKEGLSFHAGRTVQVQESLGGKREDRGV